MNAGDRLVSRHCTPCEGGVPPLAPDERARFAAEVPQWQIVGEGARIRRELIVKDFVTALDYFHRIGALAEEEGHHPDLHLTQYRRVAIELWTHAAGGLTENDFILAAKIEQLPVELQRPTGR
jgi:4a-hydroxytetrahydrobiopterin dehydratase